MDFLKINLIYWKDNQFEQIGTLENLDENKLMLLSNVSTYGENNERLTDLSVRNSREIDAKYIFGEFKQNVLSNIQFSFSFKNIGENFEFENLSVKPNKLLIYNEGSFFVEHKDDSEENGFLGTIVLCLSDKYTGGNLIVKDKSYKLKKYEYIYFDNTCEHSVEEVKSGTRICLTFKVFKRKTYVPYKYRSRNFRNGKKD